MYYSNQNCVMDTLEIQLMDAIRQSKIDVIQSLLDKGVNVNYVPTCGTSPLSTAAALGNVPLIHMLLNADKTSNRSAQGDLSLRKHRTEAKFIDDDKENQNDCLTYGNRTSIERKQNLGYYIFVHNDDPGEIEGFCERDINKNENLDAETPEGMDGLEWDVEVEGEGEEEPDDVWSSQYRWYADILDKTGGLTEERVQGCDLNLQDYTGRCAVHYAVEYSQLEALHCLMFAGCKIDVGDVDNVTPLHLAAMKDHQHIAELLIDRGANVNSKTTDKMAPLHYAAVRGFVEMVALLIHGGAAVDPLDANDRTPLMLAVTRNHVDVVEVLITYGAKINIEEIHGYTPLCEAVWNKSVGIASLLLKAGAKQTQSQHLLHYTVLHRHLAMTELLLKYKAYPNLRDDHGDTPLLLAITGSNVDMVKLLLQYEANPNYASNITNLTPLLKALCICLHESLFEEILRLLCLYNVDLNFLGGSTLMTPIMCAMYEEELNCAVYLIRAGADVNSSNRSRCQSFHNNKQLTCLDFAMSAQADSLVHLMVAAGFDLSQYNLEYPKDFSKVDMESITGWLTFMKFNPHRLTDLCRRRIRSHMGSKGLHVIPTLEIPQSLKQFLLYKDVYVEKFTKKPLAKLCFLHT